MHDKLLRISSTGRMAILLSMGALVISLTSERAVAAPPSNDTIGGAMPATIEFSAALDTTEATTDSDDAQLNSMCGAPATDASVWYALTVASDTNVVIDVSQSSYAAGILVGVGSPGSLLTITCGPGAVSFFAVVGTTYYVLVIDDQGDGGGNGGLLNIAFSEFVLPPTPTLDITVDRFGQVNSRTGVARISGTYTCTDGDFLDVSGEARQNVGRFTVSGNFSFFDFGTCDGASHSWTADVFPVNGKFAGGKAITVTFAYSCGPLECANGYVEQTVQLRGGR